MNDLNTIARKLFFENSFEGNCYTRNYAYDKNFGVERNFELWLKVVRRVNFNSGYNCPEDTFEEMPLSSIKEYFQRELYAYFRIKFSEFIKEQEESLEEEEKEI